MRTLEFVGCRRSGNHAIIEWVASHFSNALHHNDLPQKWDGGYRNGQVLEYADPDRTEAGPCEIRSWEDKLAQPGQIIILRSAYNVAASRVGSPANLRTTSRAIWRFLEVWPQHAKIASPRVLYDKWLFSWSPVAIALDLPLPYVAPDEDLRPRKGKQTLFTQSRNQDRLERWRTVSLPQEVLDNDEIRELNHLIFGWTLSSAGVYQS